MGVVGAGTLKQDGDGLLGGPVGRGMIADAIFCLGQSEPLLPRWIRVLRDGFLGEAEFEGGVELKAMENLGESEQNGHGRGGIVGECEESGKALATRFKSRCRLVKGSERFV